MCTLDLIFYGGRFTWKKRRLFCKNVKNFLIYRIFNVNNSLTCLALTFQAQARECLFEKLELQSRDGRNIDVCLDLAQEAAQVRYLSCDNKFRNEGARASESL